jgi:hypothetical protein
MRKPSCMLAGGTTAFMIGLSIGIPKRSAQLWMTAVIHSWGS